MGLLRSSSMLQSMIFTFGRGLVTFGALRLYWYASVLMILSDCSERYMAKQMSDQGGDRQQAFAQSFRAGYPAQLNSRRCACRRTATTPSAGSTRYAVPASRRGGDRYRPCADRQTPSSVRNRRRRRHARLPPDPSQQSLRQTGWTANRRGPHFRPERRY